MEYRCVGGSARGSTRGLSRGRTTRLQGKEPKPASAPLYLLHVELRDIAPAIWRRLQVPGSITLPRLHRVLQVTMGWTDCHLHRFTIGGQRYGIPFDDWPDESLHDERRVTLAGSLGAVVTDFSYEYDFGDGWLHAVQVEGTQPIDDTATGVLCTGGANACPPEDVGGPPGYFEFLQAIRDPMHPEHHELLEWCGGAFDPTGFDLNGVNASLRRLLRVSRR